MAETFGKTDKGGTKTPREPGRIYACKFASGSAGDLASISLYVEQYLSDTPHVKCAIYDSSKNLLANGATEEKVVPNAQDGFMVFSFASSPEVSATTDYYLAFWQDGYCNTYHDAGSTDQTIRDVCTYGTWPDPLVQDYQWDYEVSIFATYSEAPPAAEPALFFSHNF